MKRLKRVISLLLVLSILGFVGFMWQFNQFLNAPISTALEGKVVKIQVGSSANRIARQLHKEGFLSSPKWFVWYLRYQKQHHLIKAGEIRIDPQWSVKTLVAKLIKGQTVQYPVTLIAGQTVQQALKSIHALPKIRKTLDIEKITELQALLGFDKKVTGSDYAKYPYASIEGWLLPETYHYQSGDSDKQVILRAYQALQAELDAAWQNREKGLPLKTPYEALILASIVEKETGFAAERAKIAGVFMRRLQKRMRLQTDPTVIYGIGQSYDGNIRKRDLLTKTTYNTYRINGLPPTPIALPSREAIQAVMHPEKTKALYFVAKGGGEHHFSNTLIEHNKAVRKYLLNKR
ncbi:MAG: UPF0755 protein [Thiomicrorhabdus sp.]|nr:MAG: UPF0755 protein [Thiomicrorhabdus sp.]